MQTGACKILTALDLELTAHEGLLTIELSIGHLHEGVVRSVDGDIGLALCLALVSCTLLLEVDGVDELLRSLLDVHLKNTVRLLHDVLLLLLGHLLETALDLRGCVDRASADVSVIPLPDVTTSVFVCVHSHLLEELC